MRNPKISYNLQKADEGAEIIVRIIDEQSFETIAEVRYDNVNRLGGCADALNEAAAILRVAQTHGFEEAVEKCGLEMAMVPVDLTDVDLTVDDILGA